MTNDELLQKLASFVIKVIDKDEPSDAELAAMVRLSNLLIQQNLYPPIR